MGDRIPAYLHSGDEDYEPGQSIIRASANYGYSVDELKEFTDKDACCQKYRREIKKLMETQPPTTADLLRARASVQKVFMQWQGMRNFQGIQQESLYKLKMAIRRRTIWLAARKASFSIHRIQLALGVQPSGHRKRSKEFLVKHSVRPSLRLREIERELQKPLVVPNLPLPSESKPTPN